VFRLSIVFVFSLVAAVSQEHDMSNMLMGGSRQTGGFLMNLASGTSMNPQSWPMPMLMLNKSDWTFMLMGQAFLVDMQETGPRGHAKLYSPNYGMFAATHDLGRGSFMFETMLSLEPATITDRRYPLLFQTGETAYGTPLVDAQHPHDFFMGLGLHYAHPLGENTTLQVYYAPVGDPALGPVAFPHRASAAELPQATLAHHWEDSSHIANNVLTVGIMHKKVRLEASGFYGTEPNENRWNIDFGPMNSWATRLSYFATKNWTMQVSVGRLAKPERQEEGDVLRSTASIHYTRPMLGSSWSTSLIWGRNHKTLTKENGNAYTLESVLPFTTKNFVTGRIELVDKDELVPGQTFRIGAYTAGYTRDIGTFHNVESGIGANFTSYSMPDAAKFYYGNHPVSINIFARFRLNPN
jgi:hypothetical protein